MIPLDAKLGNHGSPVIFLLRVVIESQTGSRAVQRGRCREALWPRRFLLRSPLSWVISWTGPILLYLFFFFFFKVSDVFWFSVRGN